jgi:hypothetical protein
LKPLNHEYPIRGRIAGSYIPWGAYLKKHNYLIIVRQDSSFVATLRLTAVTQMSKEIKISRVWAMPNKHTFKIKPIAELVRRYAGDGKGWIDPFAGYNSPAELTNDINPDTPALYHLDAIRFCDILMGDWKGVLFDPPYSLRQLKECYKGVGLSMTQEDSNLFPQNIKQALVRFLPPGSIAITFGWNSQGFGKNLGFEIIEILLVAHGRSHNDTIVVVEKKMQECDATEDHSSTNDQTNNV